MKKKLILVCLLFLAVSVSFACKKKPAEGEKQPVAVQPDATQEVIDRKKSFFNGNIRLVVPYAAGETDEMVARKFADIANEILRADGYEGKLFCEYEMGDDGLLAATNFVQKKPEDKELMVTSYNLWYQKMRRGINFDVDLDKIVPVGIIGDRSYLLYVKKGAYADLKSFLETSKRRNLIFSCGPIGSDSYLCAGALVNQFGGTFSLHSYDDEAEQIKALFDNEVDGFVGTPQSAMEYMSRGEVDVLCCFKPEDFSGFADTFGITVPSVVKLGFPNACVISGEFVSAVKGTSEEHIAEIKELVSKVWQRDEYRKFIAENGLNKLEIYFPDLIKYVREAQVKTGLAMKSLRII